MNYRNSVGTRLLLSFAGVIIVFGAAVGLSISRLAAFRRGLERNPGPLLAKVETTDALGCDHLRIDAPRAQHADHGR